jgi:hypothetical protein
LDIGFADITAENLTRLPYSGNSQWDNEGVLHLQSFIPEELIDDYVEERTRLLGDTSHWREGWSSPTPYLHVESMRKLALYRPLTEKIKTLINGDEPGLHLCLTGFQSTERAWHQDRYLNPEKVGERYIAAWIALDDIHPDSGPFQYVEGSHRWPVIERGKVWKSMTALGQKVDPATWPSQSQGWVGNACDQEIRNRSGVIQSFVAKKGDVLLWHASLVHRGSLAKNRTLERRALISHYSSIHARPDMPRKKTTEQGSYYFDFTPRFPRLLKLRNFLKI